VVQTRAQAEAELRRLKTAQGDNQLQIIGRAPKLKDYVERYLAAIELLREHLIHQRLISVNGGANR
jgi:hypothetical protein